MSDTAITVRNLSKSYVLAHQADSSGGRYRYRRFSDALIKTAKAPFQILRKTASIDTLREEFWALKDISFEIKRGEVVGIIGRNGAGKSTLLKILSRITEPTSGHIEIEGRLASLLEVGTGFHPELTGRENIYLNGAILGMGRAEIRKKFDEIVAFAEVDKFLDTQVKHYSSGMYVRLAFSVSAHLEPDILIVDEVLAVGDMQFQKKCLGKMQDVSANHGRTVLFVSHNLTAVQILCNKAIFLKSGQIVGLGDVEKQITEYLKGSQTETEEEMKGPFQLSPGLNLVRFKFNPNPVASNRPVEFVLEMSAASEIRLNEMALLIYSNLGVRVAILDLRSHGVSNLSLPQGLTALRGTIRSLPLVEGDYQVGLYVSTDTLSENHLDLASLQMIAPADQSHVPYPAMHRGLVELDFSLKIESEQKKI